MGFKPKHAYKALKVAVKVAPIACKTVEYVYPPAKLVTYPIRTAAKAGKAFL